MLSQRRYLSWKYFQRCPGWRRLATAMTPKAKANENKMNLPANNCGEKIFNELLY
jgi:hypothetical protein